MSHKRSFLRQPKDKPEVLISGFSTWRVKTWNQNSISEIFFIFFRPLVCETECIACQLGPLGSELLRISTIIGEIWDQLCKSYKTWLEKEKPKAFKIDYKFIAGCSVLKRVKETCKKVSVNFKLLGRPWQYVWCFTASSRLSIYFSWTVCVPSAIAAAAVLAAINLPSAAPCPWGLSMVAIRRL